MKKRILIPVLLILLASSLVFAQEAQNQSRNQTQAGDAFQNGSLVRTQERVRESIEFSPWQKRNESECLQGCRCNGAVMSCPTENGKEMTIEAGRSGNVITITIVKNGNETEADTELELELENESGSQGNKTKIMTQLSNGRNAEIKIMPDVASERALERLRLRVCTSENNCTLELKEVPVRDENRLAYEIHAEKQSRVLGLFKAKMQVQAQIDAETGEVIQSKKPWWAFLASESE